MVGRQWSWTYIRGGIIGSYLGPEVRFGKFADCGGMNPHAVNPYLRQIGVVTLSGAFRTVKKAH
jgi:hypothetical protein